MYSVIAKHLMDNPIIISQTQGNRRNLLKYRKQLVWMLGTVVFSFFICLLPFRALTLWIIVVPNETILKMGIDRYYCLLYFCRIMLYINSAINPIFYNLMSSKFRNGFSKLIGCKLMVRNVKWSESSRKSTLNTNSTNLSYSIQQSIRLNSIDNQRNAYTHQKNILHFSEVSLQNNAIKSSTNSKNYSLVSKSHSNSNEEMLFKSDIDKGDTINNKISEITKWDSC